MIKCHVNKGLYSGKCEKNDICDKMKIIHKIDSNILSVSYIFLYINTASRDYQTKSKQVKYNYLQGLIINIIKLIKSKQIINKTFIYSQYDKDKGGHFSSKRT